MRNAQKSSQNASVEAEITLYGRWRYVLTFDSTGGVATTSSKSVVYGQKYGALPNANRTGYIIYWMVHRERQGKEKVTENDTVTKGFDYTLYAHWISNNYTVTLNVNGGDTLLISEFAVTYDQPYNCLPNATRTGHTFIGWFTDGGIEVTNETTANITADNHILYAHWTINNYTVTFCF